MTAIDLEASTMRERLRTFHLTGHGLEQAMPAGALRPVALDEIALPQLESAYPLCILTGQSPQPLAELLSDFEHLPAIVSAFRAAIAQTDPRSVARIVDVLGPALASLRDCPPGEVSRIRQLLAGGGILVEFRASSLPLLHGAALAQARRVPRQQFLEEVNYFASRLRELLAVDESHAPQAVTPQNLSESMGSGVLSFLCTEVLSKALLRPANPWSRMEPARRSRCETTLATLEAGLAGFRSGPGFCIFHSVTAPRNVEAFGGELQRAEDPFAAAVEYCDHQLDRLLKLLRAMRVAMLEIESRYDPAFHDEVLARLDWQSAHDDQLHALSAVVVLESADRLAEASLTSFGKLLRSGRPIQVLVETAGLKVRHLSEFPPDIGYVSIAHREAFVLQSSLSCPQHLIPGLAAMARSLRPAIAVVESPVNGDDQRDPWLESILLTNSRTVPIYCYDPAEGVLWAERFKLLNPTGTGDLTPVQAAAVSPDLRGQFRILSAAEWDADQVELGKYLEECNGRSAPAIPFIWVKGPAGTQDRAVITRDLANFCVDRRRAWAGFEQLGGPAPATAPPIDNQQARREGAREAIHQVLDVLARVQ